MKNQSANEFVKLFFDSREDFSSFARATPSMEEKSRRILYMGCADFSLPPLKALINEGYNVVAVATQPDRPVGRKQKLTPTCVKVMAEKFSLPVYEWERLSKEQLGNDLETIQPDLIITSAYGNILPKQVLDFPRYGCLNIHPSKLPRWRGASPVASAILEGDEITALSIIEMGEGLDDGDIVGACDVPINSTIDTQTLTAELAELSAEFLLVILPFWYRGVVDTLPQDEKLANYAKKLDREDGALDFRLSAQENANKVRALTPWPGTFAYHEGKRYKIHKASVLNEILDKSLKTGEIVRHDKDLIIACNDGFLKVEILQGPGGKRLEARDCYHNFGEGTCFSNICED